MDKVPRLTNAYQKINSGEEGERKKATGFILVWDGAILIKKISIAVLFLYQTAGQRRIEQPQRLDTNAC